MHTRIRKSIKEARTYTESTNGTKYTIISTQIETIQVVK